MADLELKVLADRKQSGAIIMDALNSKHWQVIGYEENQVNDDNANNVIQQGLWK